MPSDISYQHRDEKPRDEEVDDNSVEFPAASSSHTSPPGQPNGIQPTIPLGALGGTGDSIPRSVQHWQSWVPPSNSQSTSHGCMPTQGPSLNQTPGPSSRPESNNGKSRANTQSDSASRQIISGFMPNVKNENAFNTNNYYDRPKRAKKSRRSKKRQEETSSESSSSSDQ